MMGIFILYQTKKIWGGCHHLLLVYDASMLSKGTFYSEDVGEMVKMTLI